MSSRDQTESPFRYHESDEAGDDVRSLERGQSRLEPAWLGTAVGVAKCERGGLDQRCRSISRRVGVDRRPGRHDRVLAHHRDGVVGGAVVTHHDGKALRRSRLFPERGQEAAQLASLVPHGHNDGCREALDAAPRRACKGTERRRQTPHDDTVVASACQWPLGQTRLADRLGESSARTCLKDGCPGRGCSTSEPTTSRDARSTRTGEYAGSGGWLTRRT